jgi:hypothetical protein
VPLLTVQTWVYNVLNGMPLPGNASPLAVFVTPPNPEENQLDPHCYVWPSSGSESRESVPRPPGTLPGAPPVPGQAGRKAITHSVDIWLTWFGDDSDPSPDFSFPVIVDAVMDALRTTRDPALQADPVTGRVSQIYGTGERLTYDLAVPRGTDRDQRILRYDARIAARIGEELQA